MTKVTYVGDKASVEWAGISFEKNAPVELDPENRDHVPILKKVPGNPSFKIAEAEAEAA